MSILHSLSLACSITHSFCIEINISISSNFYIYIYISDMAIMEILDTILDTTVVMVDTVDTTVDMEAH